MATDCDAEIPVAYTLAAAILLWPAVWNGYPLVFADTGTYLSQAIEHYVGWDRPVFYSLFLLSLHMTVTTWPVIAAQGLLVVHVLRLTQRALLPDASVWWLPPLAGALAIATSLPWFASQLMPDLFTGLLVLVLALLIFVPERLGQHERIWLMLLATFLIVVHQSHVPLALMLLIVLLPLRRALGGRIAMGKPALFTVATPLMLAVAALVSVNVFAFGRASLSPFGNVFILARLISDGPGMRVLRQRCPDAGWRLCKFVDRIPPTSDEFLWREEGPLIRAGGAKLVSAEAGAIIHAAVRTEPTAVARAIVNNTLSQLGRFATGDGLEAWPTAVTPWVEREFPPFEAAIYAASRQTQGRLWLPTWLRAFHTSMALGGVAACCWLTLSRARRRHPASGFAAAALLAVVVNAAITGGLSGPHDRYQSRIMWLPPLVTLLGVATLRAGREPSGAR